MGRICGLSVAAGIPACRMAGWQDAAGYGSQDGCRYTHGRLADAPGAMPHHGRDGAPPSMPA